MSATSDYLLRLAIALPLICALAAGLIWLARRSGWRLPTGVGAHMRNAAIAKPLQILTVESLSPAARVAVIRFAGRDHLVGVSGTALHLLATADIDLGEHI